MTIATITDSNKKLVTQFVSAIWNAKTFDRLADFVSEDYQQHNPSLPDGRGALEGFLRGFYAANMPNGEFVVRMIVAEDDLVVTNCLF